MSVRALRRGSIAASRVSAPTTVNTFYAPDGMGDSVSTPDSVAVSITGDIDIRAKAKLADWTPAADVGLVRKYGTSGNRSYSLYVQATTGKLLFRYSAIGTTQLDRLSTVATGITDGTAHWVRVTVDVDNGASGHDVIFYTSTDGSSWTQLGATVTTAGVTSLFDSGTAVFAASPQGTNVNLYYAEIRNGIGGSVAAKFDPSTVTPTGTRTPASFVSSTGETWTMNGTTWDWVAA